MKKLPLCIALFFVILDVLANNVLVEADPESKLRGGVLADLMPRPKKVVEKNGVFKGNAENVTIKKVCDEELGTFDAPLEGFDNEGYRLTATTDSIKIEAVSDLGVLRARQTLYQLSTLGKGKIPCCEITDWPAFKVRGYMHDVGRSFISYDKLRTHLELLSRFKVNVFHWHLTDHYGFRFESKIHPRLNQKGMARFEGKYYTQEQCRELDSIAYSLGVCIIPEIDMPGHSVCFTQTMGFSMASQEGRAVLKDVLHELADCFPHSLYIHIGCDETADATPAFINEMSEYVCKDLGRKVIVWNRLGNGSLAKPEEYRFISMCQNWASAGTKVVGIPNIDCRYNYVNHFDVFADVVGIYKSTILGQTCGSHDVAGAITALWNDRYIADENQIIAQNNLFANALVTNERAWMGGGEAYIEEGGTILPNDGDVFRSFADWERRFLLYKQLWLSDQPIPYVRQTNVVWNLTPAYNNGNDVTKSFPIEYEKELTVKPDDQTVTGAGVYLLHTWPTAVPGLLGKCTPDSHYGTTCYAWTYVYSPKSQTVGAQIEFQNYGRSERDKAPDYGCWDWKGSRVWVNDEEVLPPLWGNSDVSISWASWEDYQKPLLNENFPARKPAVVCLKKGWNKVLLKLPYINVPQVRLNKWMWTFVFTDLEGRDAVDGLIYSPTK